MTTLSALPTPVRRYIAGFVERRRRLALLRAGGVAAAFFLVWMLAWCIVDRLTALPAAVRCTLLVVGLAAVVVVLFRPLRAVLANRIDWVAAAAEIESRNPAFAERLQTVISRMIGPPEYRGSQQLVDHLLHQVQAEVQDEEPARLLDLRPAVQPWIAAALLTVATIVLMFNSWLDLPRLMLRFAAPFADVAPATTTRITVRHEPTQVVQGQPLTFIASATRLGNSSLCLHLSTDDRHYSMRPMSPSDDGYTYTLQAVDRDLYYYASGGDAQTPVQRIEVLRQPTILEYRVRYAYPPYIGRQPLTITSPDGSLEAPVGTDATLTIRSSEPLSEAQLIMGDQTIAMTATADPAVRHATIRITRNDNYRLRLTTHRGATSELAEPIRIVAIPDRPPLVRIIQPSENLRLTPRDVAEIRFQALDDYGIRSLRLVASVNGEDRHRATLRLRGDPARQEALVDVDLARLELAFGDIVRLRVEAEDLNGHTAASEPRTILIAPRSIDMNTYLRLAELRQATAGAEALIKTINDALKSLEQMGQGARGDVERDIWTLTADYDRQLTSATEQASLIRQALLRTLVRSPTSGRSILLSHGTDAAQQIASTTDSLLLQTPNLPRSDVMRMLEQAAKRATELRDLLVTVSHGEQATALLADHANLQALGGRDTDPVSEAAQQTYRRAREEFQSAVKTLGLNPDDQNLAQLLDRKVKDLAERERKTGVMDFVPSAAEWSKAPTMPVVGQVFPQRLETAAQAEAVRPDADLIRAHDLHLASRAAEGLIVRASVADDEGTAQELADYPPALGALQAAHALSQSPQDVRPPEQVAQILAAADAARQRMRVWAGDVGSDQPVRLVDADPDAADAAHVMEANAAMARRDYDRAATIDQQMRARDGAVAPAGDMPATSCRLQDVSANAMAGVPTPLLPDHRRHVDDAMQQARRLDEIAQQQAELSRQTALRQAEHAEALSRRQAELAGAIDQVHQDQSLMNEDSPFAPDNTRERALAAIQAARQRLAAMPQDLTEVQQNARQRHAATEAFRQALAAVQAAPPDARPAAERRAAAAEEAQLDAEDRLQLSAQMVHPDVAAAIADRLQPFVPETLATIVAIEEKLVASLRSLEQAIGAADLDGTEKAVADARAAISDVQAELRAAQDALAAQDPLVAARWFARQAAAALAMKPPDFEAAEHSQQQVAEALDRAWSNAAHDAARGRLAGSAAFSGLYMVDLPLIGGAMGPGIVEDDARPSAGRSWGWFRRSHSTDITTSDRDADPPGYQQALRAYFEALGAAGQEQNR